MSKYFELEEKDSNGIKMSTSSWVVTLSLI